jgi:hypothetical protein
MNLFEDPNVPGDIMKQVRVTLPRRKELTICKSSEQEWFILKNGTLNP